MVDPHAVGPGKRTKDQINPEDLKRDRYHAQPAGPLISLYIAFWAAFCNAELCLLLLSLGCNSPGPDPVLRKQQLQDVMTFGKEAAAQRQV